MSVGSGHYNYILEITVSFLGIQKYETDSYIGFSPALHLQCRLGIIVSLGFKDVGIKQTSLYLLLNSLLAEVKNRVPFICLNKTCFQIFLLVQRNWYLYCLFTFT